MDGDVVVNKKVWRGAQGKYFLKKVGSERDESALPFENDSERRKEKGWRGGEKEAAVITQSRHVHSDVPQTPIKEFVDRMH